MKIQLEFEDEDLRKMIIDYFEREGFEVKNIDELCELFKGAFPDGIKVHANILPDKPAETPRHSARAQPVEDDEDEPVATDDNPPLGFTQLLDPTPSRRTGRMEAVINRDVDGSDIQDVIRRSRELEQRGPRNV
jgi:DNA-binding transcriptional MerR regulator